MSSVRMRVASSDWCASRSTRSVTITFFDEFAMIFSSPLEAVSNKNYGTTDEHRLTRINNLFFHLCSSVFICGFKKIIKLLLQTVMRRDRRADGRRQVGPRAPGGIS